MHSNKITKWFAESLWWLATAIIAILVFLPFHIHGIQFPFWDYNLAFVIVGITFVRYVFFFEHHPWSSSKFFKVGMIFLIPVVFFPILEGLHSFIEFNDRVGIQSLLEHLPHHLQGGLINYIRGEYLFFGVSSMISAFAIIIKMIRALWRQYKYPQHEQSRRV